LGKSLLTLKPFRIV